MYQKENVIYIYEEVVRVCQLVLQGMEVLRPQTDPRLPLETRLPREACLVKSRRISGLVGPFDAGD